MPSADYFGVILTKILLESLLVFYVMGAAYEKHQKAEYIYF